MAKKVAINQFVRYLERALTEKCGYIMSSYGQDPKKWSKTSWWFSQYRGAQRKKALYWREHAPLVFDCNGLAEGCYLAETRVNINARARNNYGSWCTHKGGGRIPAKYRVPGAAVFMHNGSYISHVGYLWKPVTAGKPAGDWWVIEARGVLYGVVKTRLYVRGWNRYGWMTKYFDYSAPDVSTAPSVPVERVESTAPSVLILPVDPAIPVEPIVPAKPDIARAAVRGCCPDVSKYQKAIDFDKLCAHCDFIILRARVNGKTDPRFKEWAAECARRAFPFSAYDFLTLRDREDALAQALRFYRTASPYKPRIYYLDVETLAPGVGHAANRKLIAAYVEQLRALGAERIGLYTSDYWYRTRYRALAPIFDTLWIADWGANDGYLSSVPKTKCDLHQYTSNGYTKSAGAPGIAHRVDLNRLTGRRELAYFTGREHAEDAYRGIVRITGGAVNIRSTPATDQSPLGTAKKGALFARRAGDTDLWYAISYKGKDAYVAKAYAKAGIG